MRSGASASSVESSAATVHVLSKIDSTSSRKVRSHDISHLLDGAPCLAPRIPPSLIREEDHIYEKCFLPEEFGSTFNEQDGMWYVRVFPSDKPSSRTDAVMLDAWITRSLERCSHPSPTSPGEELASSVETLVPILSVGLHEIVRQVTHHCAERGLALEKIWRTYVELFDRVLRQMRDSLREQRRKTVEMQRMFHEVRAEVREAKRRHPEDVQSAIKSLEEEFVRAQQDSEDELKRASDENMQLQQELKAHRSELDAWFPGFSFYQESYIKNGLPHRHLHSRAQAAQAEPSSRASSRGGGSASPSRSSSKAVANREEADVTVEAAEVAVAEDLKRLLAVLAPDKRRMIGQELSFIMETNDVANGPRIPRKPHAEGRRGSLISRVVTQQVNPGAEDEAKVLEQLRADVRAQEDRIQELREEISRVETGQADEVEGLLAEAAQTAQPRASVSSHVAAMEEELSRCALGETEAHMEAISSDSSASEEGRSRAGSIQT